MRSTPELLRDVGILVDAWCDRRCLRALRAILAGWPLESGLTSEWGGLLDALEKVRALANEELTDAERERVEDAIRDVARVVRRE